MPKGGASSLTPVYAGLREDLDSFLKSFLQLETVRFDDFKKLFEYRGMIKVFNGRSNSAEIIEFNECLLNHCLPYMQEYVCHGVPRSLNERLFGLYSLFTYFYVQQYDHVVKVRMDPDSVRNFIKLAELLLEEKIYDAYMACLKLLEDKAIKHVAFIQIHDPANFKRFYTDEKVSGVSIQTNMNDPLGHVKALVEKDVFKKLEIIRKVYTKKKETAGFDGTQLEDIPHKIIGIVEHYSKEAETVTGVDEIINTDHSFEQLATRGMLRTSLKDQAHSADLKLARYRRHRSATPLSMPTDTFDYIEEFAPEMKNIKPEKPDQVEPDAVGASPPLKRRTRQGRKIKSEEASTLPEKEVPVKKLKIPLKKPEPLESNVNIPNPDSQMDTVNKTVDMVVDVKAVATKPRKLKIPLKKLEPMESHDSETVLGSSSATVNTNINTLRKYKTPLKKPESMGCYDLEPFLDSATEMANGVADNVKAVVDKPRKLRTPLKKLEPLDSDDNEPMGSSTNNVNEIVKSTGVTVVAELKEDITELFNKPPRSRRAIQKNPKIELVELEETKPENIHLDDIADSADSIKGDIFEQQPDGLQQTTLMENREQFYIDELEVALADCCRSSTQPTTPRSILKTQKTTMKRNVSFRMKEDGMVETTIHEIPSRACMDEENKNKKNEMSLPDIPESVPDKEKTEDGDETQFDDADMFRPFPGEEDLEFGSFGIDSDPEMEIDEDM